MNKKVIIAHYNKNIEWVDKINKDINFEIHSTSNDKINGIPSDKITFVEPNKGMDANMYLNFIIKNYEKLPDKILFIHHHETDWSHDYPLSYIINNLNWDYSNYINIGCQNCYTNLYTLNNGDYLIVKDWFKDVWYLFDEYLHFPDTSLFYNAGTQFMVDKELILQYPKIFYQRLYDWLITTEWPDYKSGRVFEYLWHYILTKNCDDKKFNPQEIFKL